MVAYIVSILSIYIDISSFLISLVALRGVDSKLNPKELAADFSGTFLDPFRNAAHRGFKYADIFGNDTIVDVVKAAYEDHTSTSRESSSQRPNAC